jgi:prepilin-type N-terminal cleavage/methylation domain-containing protein
MKKNAFTLVELLVVISIIGVLTAVLMMNLVGARERAKDTRTIQSLSNLKNALRMYYNDNNTYPLSLASLGSTYVSDLDTVGLGYTQLDGGNGFRITTMLEVGAGSEDENSQTKCGILTPTPGLYAVCAN